MIYKLGRRNGVFVIGASKTISNLTIEDAVNKIIESKYGLHCMIIYPNLPTFRNFYTYYIKRQLDEKNEIILFNPFYETVGMVRQNLSMGHVHVDEYEYKSDISLIIADSLNQYFGKVPMVKFKERLVKYAIEKRKDGISILSDMGSYFFKMLYKELIHYELSLPIQFDAPLKGLCVYNQLDFDNRLTEKQKQDMVDHHSMAIELKSI
ncbi:MAG TPA: hypothetical protein VJR94_07515 [Candidatus Nitrosocosmicus sp.]|nr:hypothetical protein [Candidatus Nitrosocosmicus sp.]